MSTNWKLTPLGDVCDVVGGGTPAKDRTKFYGGDIPWATVRDMRTELIANTEFKITPLAVKSSSTNIIPKGNVVIATRVGLGKVCLLQQDTAINQDLRAIIPKDTRRLSVPFLFWWLKSIAHLIEAEGTGATVQGVKLPFVKSLRIPIASPADQRRVVAILDETFAGLATAIANAEKNLKNARELFESYLNSVFEKDGKGWESKLLGDICGLQNGFAFKSQLFRASGVPVLRISNIHEEQVDPLEVVFADQKDYRENLKKYLIRPGDLLIAMSGATTGKIGFNLTSTEFYLNQRVGKFEPGEQLTKKFLFYYLLTKVEENLLISAGSAQPNLSSKQIRELSIPLPSKAEQEDICEALDEIRNSCQNLEDVYSSKSDELASLKQSILQKAFSGELTSPPLQAIKEAAE